MGTIHVNYEEVRAETARLRGHISSDIINRANSEYRQIQSSLRRVDGATNSNLIQFMEANHQKTVKAAAILDHLLQSIAVSATAIEIQEQKIARIFSAGRR